MLPRWTRVDRYPDVWVGLAKQKILFAVNKFGLITAEQTADYLGSRKSITTVRENLKELFHSRYTQRIFLHKTTPLGSSKAIYTPDRKLRSYLKAQGIEPTRKSNMKSSLWGLEHTLVSNDLMLVFRRYVRESGTGQVTSFYSERECQNLGLKVIPDGWLSFYHPSRGLQLFWLEADRGTMSRVDIMKKIKTFIEEDGCKAFFRSYSVMLFVATDGKPKRALQLKKWVEEALTELRAEPWARVFGFAAFVPSTVNPEDVLAGKIWWTPFKDQQFGLEEAKL